MKKAIYLMAIALAFIVSNRVHAQQLDLFPEIEIQENIDALKDGCDYTHNGDCNVYKYDVKNFDAKKAFQELNANENHDEMASYRMDSETNASSIAENDYIKQANLKTPLKFLINKGQVKAIFAFYPNEEQCTEPEYCSIYRVYIYLLNGEVVYYNFDLTT